jgi:hypothetical protein
LNATEVRGKRFCVIGGARSGVAVAKLLKHNGARVFLSDKAAAEKMQQAAAELGAEGIDHEFGANTDRVLEADVLVLSPGVPSDMHLVRKSLQGGIKIVSEVEVASWFCPSPIIAITGTNGKTTTTALTGRIFEDAKHPGIVGGNIGTAFSQIVDQLSPHAAAILEIVLYATFFYASLYLLRTAADSRRVILLLFTVALVVASVNVAYHYRQGMWKMIDRGYPFWDGKNALGLFMVLTLSLSAALIVRPETACGAGGHRCGWRTAAFAPGLFVIFLCAVYSYSRGAWIAMAGAALLFSLFRSWRLVALLVAFLLFIEVGRIHDRQKSRSRATGLHRDEAGFREPNVNIRS